MLEVAAGIHRRFGAAALPNYVISKCQSVSDLLEVAILLKEVGLLQGNALAVNIVPLFETIDDLERSPDDHARRRSRCRSTAAGSTAATAGRR